MTLPADPVKAEETRKKMSASGKGKHTGEKSPLFGKHPSAATKARTSAAMMGKKNCLGKRPSEEHKAKISAAMMGNKHALGMHHTEKTRLSMIEAHLGGFWYGNVRYDERPQYCEKWTSDLRERVRAYRGYVCIECGAPQEEKKLAIHHVHYDKGACCNGSPRDLVPLCNSCHCATNYNREYWEGHFTELIYAMDPDGKCFFTKDEMKAFQASK